MFSDRFPDVPQNAWHEAYNAALSEHGHEDPAREERRAGITHEAILLASAFDQLKRVSVLERRYTPLTHFIHRALSYGKAWSGDAPTRHDALASTIREVLAPYVREDGTIEEIVDGQALVARRALTSR